MALRFLLASGIPNLAALLLVSGRFVGLLFVAPQLVRCPIAYPIRIGLIVALSLVVTPVVAMQDGVQNEIVQLAYQSTSTGSQFAFNCVGLVVNELILGTLLGVCVFTFLAGLKAAGMWVERHSGLNQGNIINPDWMAGDSPAGNLITLLAIASLLLIDPIGGHWPLFRSLLCSFQQIPIGTGISSLPVDRLLSNVIQESLVLGLRLTMPLLVTMSFVDATLAMANRLGSPMPSLNFVAARLSVGLAALALSVTTIPDAVYAVWASLVGGT